MIDPPDPPALPTPQPVVNGDIRWDAFNSDEYWARNYGRLLPEDRQILGWVSRFFGDHFRGQPRVARAVDVGAGPNLYPALLMLPWAEHLLLTDYAESNAAWLCHNAVDVTGRWTWQPFWDEIKDLHGYDRVTDPRAELAARHDVLRMDIFALPRATWELGTMFFVAESITEDVGEFWEAVRCFLASLTGGAPFAAAFMGQSEGYHAGELQLPAVPVGAAAVKETLNALGATGLQVLETAPTSDVPRPGYDNMIIALGVAG